MTSITQSKDQLIRNALRANSLFSGISGVIILFDSGFLVDFMGAGTSLFYLALGVDLLIYAAVLFYFSGQASMDKRVAWFAIDADVLWVLGSAVILLGNMFDISIAGKWLILIIADIVLVFAIVQYLGIRRLR